MMKHLRGIRENIKFGENIELIDELLDLFVYLEDDWGMDVDVSFIQSNYSPNIGIKRYQKFDRSGRIVKSWSETTAGEYEFGIIVRNIWLITAKGYVDTSDKALEVFQQTISSIKQSERVTGLENLATKSTIGFFPEPSRHQTSWKSFYFDDDEISRLKNYLELSPQNKKVNISIQFTEYVT